jgi:hypothetical protein
MRISTFNLTLATTLLWASTAFAAYNISNLPELKDKFCKDHYPLKQVRQSLQDTRNQLSFRNQGGLINGGVCWWHSRFTRNTSYLAAFAPDLPTPTNEEAVKIIKKIRKGKRVVVIPGYKDLAAFSYDFRDEIQRELEGWQKVDGFIGQQWAVGLWGSNEVSASEMQERMDDLYQQVIKQDRVTYQMLQIKGIDSHAWLVIDMEKIDDGGYALTVIDSNYTQDHQTYYFRPGMTHLSYGYLGSFVPYTGKKRELKRMEKKVRKLCQ